MALLLDLKVGESVSIDHGKIVLTLEEKGGQRARLRLDADRSVSIGPPERRLSLTQPPVAQRPK